MHTICAHDGIHSFTHSTNKCLPMSMQHKRFIYAKFTKYTHFMELKNENIEEIFGVNAIWSPLPFIGGWNGDDRRIFWATQYGINQKKKNNIKIRLQSSWHAK